MQCYSGFCFLSFSLCAIKGYNSCKGCRLGQVENARRHLFVPGQQPDPAELQKLLEVEKHLSKCSDARRIGDWRSALREGDAAIAAGADSSPQVGSQCLRFSFILVGKVDVNRKWPFSELVQIEFTDLYV